MLRENKGVNIMFGKIKWLTLILLVFLCVTCELEDKNKKPPLGYVFVSFDRNGGTGSVPSQRTEQTGTTITLPNAAGLEKGNHYFGGWNTNDAGTGINYPSGSSFIVPDSDITLYANWIELIGKTKKTKTEIYYYTGSSQSYPPSDPTYPSENPAGYPEITIEVYALGAGGGGQGGHNGRWNSTAGVGAGGGGGGAAYMMLSVNELVPLEISVGRGGSGGNPYTGNWGTAAWNSGYAGTDGGETTVRWASENITLTAEGGIKAAQNRSANKSGSGGLGGYAACTITSSFHVPYHPARGLKGSDGKFEGSNGGSGGSAASITGVGSILSFGGSSFGKGGDGGFNTGSGRPGEPGQVIIVTTWYE